MGDVKLLNQSECATSKLMVRRATIYHVLSKKASGTPLFWSLGKRLTHLSERSFCLIDHLERHGASG